MNFPWLTDEEVDELKRFKKHHDKEDRDHQKQTNPARCASSPGLSSELLHERTTARPVSTFNTPPIF